MQMQCSLVLFTHTYSVTDCVLVLQLLIAGLSRKETSAACAEDADLSRKLAAVLSLPVCKSASVVDGSRTTSSFWPPKSFTDSGLHPSTLPWQNNRTRYAQNHSLYSVHTEQQDGLHKQTMYAYMTFT